MSEGALYITDSRTFESYEIPIHRNTVQAVNFQAIKGPHAGSDEADQVANGLRLYDPGFRNTSVSESKITFLDSSQGVIQYRGYNLTEFWKTAEFEDITHLLVWGHWPSQDEKEALRSDLAKAAQDIPESVVRVIQAFPKTASPMQIIIAALAVYVGGNPNSIPAYMSRNIYHGNLPVVDKAIIRTLASFQVCATLAFCHQAGIAFTPADPNGSFLSNTLLMMGKIDNSTGKPDPTFLYQIQRIWALGADLGFTNSTSAFLLGASSLSDPLSCLISALSSGYGILHFGAAEASYRSLAKIGRKENVPYVISEVKRKEAKLFGYGHRMFKTVDPRIPLGVQIMNEIQSTHPLVEVAMEIDRIASKDEYFVSRKLQANSDLYIGVLYTALNFEASFIPIMIALMRSGGMMAHWREAMSQPINLWHPQQFYTGSVSPPPLDTLSTVKSDWRCARDAGDVTLAAGDAVDASNASSPTTSSSTGVTTSEPRSELHRQAISNAEPVIMEESPVEDKSVNNKKHITIQEPNLTRKRSLSYIRKPEAASEKPNTIGNPVSSRKSNQVSVSELVEPHIAPAA